VFALPVQLSNNRTPCGLLSSTLGLCHGQAQGESTGDVLGGGYTRKSILISDLGEESLTGHGTRGGIRKVRLPRNFPSYARGDRPALSNAPPCAFPKDQSHDLHGDMLWYMRTVRSSPGAIGSGNFPQPCAWEPPDLRLTFASGCPVPRFWLARNGDLLGCALSTTSRP